MSERMDFLNARIAELEDKIAKDKIAHQYGAELYASRYGNDPRYRIGMLDYILSGDRGGLESFAGTVQSYDQMRQAKDLQEMNNAYLKKQQEIDEQSQVNAASDRLMKLRIQKENIAAVGGDTREIDVDIARVIQQYPQLAVQDKPKDFNPRGTVDYVLAQYGDVTEANTPEEIKAAIEEVAKYNTPAAAKELNRLDKAYDKRIKMDAAKANMANLIKEWNGKGLSDGLTNAGYKEELSGDKIVLKDTNGKIVKSVARYAKKPQKSGKWD